VKATWAPPPPRGLQTTAVQVGETDLVVFEWPETEPYEPPSAHCVKELLSPREQVVAAFMARGYQNLQIAANLGVSVHTVRHQVQSIFRKTGAFNRTDFSARWFQLK